MTRENYKSFTRGGVRTFPKALSREIPPFQAARLLNHRRLRDHGGHLLRYFSFASLAAAALTLGDFGSASN